MIDILRKIIEHVDAGEWGKAEDLLWQYARHNGKWSDLPDPVTLGLIPFHWVKFWVDLRNKAISMDQTQ